MFGEARFGESLARAFIGREVAFQSMQTMTYQQSPNIRVWDLGREYVEAAEILLDYNRSQPAAILASSAIEVFQKSFLAERHHTGDATTKHGHVLIGLYRHLDDTTRDELLACSKEVDGSVYFETELAKHDRLFTDARYRYEPTAPPVISSDVIYFSRHVCEAVLRLGRKRGV